MFEWKTVKIAAVDNGFVLEIDGKIRVATAATVAAEVIAALNLPAAATADRAPRQRSAAPAAPPTVTTSVGTKPLEDPATPGAAPAATAVRESPMVQDPPADGELTPRVKEFFGGSPFTINGLVESFPRDFGSYAAANKFVQDAIACGAVAKGERKGPGYQYSFVGPVAAEPPPRAAPPTEPAAPEKDPAATTAPDAPPVDNAFTGAPATVGLPF